MTCKGICEKWENATEDEIEQDGLIWCSACFIHVRTKRTHCPCCGKRDLLGYKRTLNLQCQTCGKSYTTHDARIQNCSPECRRARRLYARKKYNRTHKENVKKYYTHHNGIRSFNKAVARVKRDVEKYGLKKETKCTIQGESAPAHTWIYDGLNGKCVNCGREFWTVFFP